MAELSARHPQQARGLGEGAAQAAPTAPHATPRTGRGKRTGPERFWARGPVRVVFVCSLALSGFAHCSLVPLRLPGAVEVDDFAGEAAIPVDVLEQGEAPVEPPPPPPPPEPAAPPAAGEARDKQAAALADAGAARDAAMPADAASDAAHGDAEATDAAPPGDGGAAGPSDPQALLASSGAVQADVIFVTVVINAIEIRKNPAAGQLGEILRSIPEWYDFMHGTEGLIDPVGDTDWILISGPSLRDSSADAVTLHYSTSDATVDRAIQIVSRRYAHGGPYDTGVPGVRAWLAHADRADRVIERPRSHVLVIVPPRRATAVARQLAHATAMPKDIMPGVATYVRVLDPHHALPSLIPEGVLEMRLWVRTRDDGGADVEIQGDCKDDETAARSAEGVARAIRQNNTFAVSLGTGGLLNRAAVTAEGKELHVHVRASREQIESTLASVLLVMPGLAGAPAPAPAPPGRAAPGPDSPAR